MKPISAYMPHPKDLMFIQAKIPRTVAEEMKQILSETNRSWADFLTASCRAYIEEYNHGSNPRSEAPQSEVPSQMQGLRKTAQKSRK